MPEFELRSAGAEDAAAIVDVMRSGLDAGLLAKLIYGCSGIAEFIRLQIESGGLSDKRYFVASDGAQVAGCAEMRISKEVLWLDYISVRAGVRRSGLGRRLLAHAIEQTWRGQAWIQLDVFDENRIAREWYLSLGFEPHSASSYWEFPRERGAADFWVADWPQAQVCQAAFGFSEFRLAVANREMQVGRIGRAWFRLRSADAADPNVRRALQEIDAERKICAILGCDAVTPQVEQTGVRILGSQRMRAPAGRVWENLSPSGGRPPDPGTK